MQHLIWVIDDSVVVRKIVEYSLGRKGYRVEGFPSGVLALSALRQGGVDVPEVIILDISLPQLDGYDVIRLLKQRMEFTTIPILILSARDGIIDRVKGRLAGAASYMIKPFKTQDLATTIAELLPKPSLNVAVLQ